MATEKEKIYDEQISPLMAKIIEVCKTHKIAMLADFALGYDDDAESELKCTSTLMDDDFEPTQEQLEALKHIRPKRPQFAAFTIMRQ